MNNVVMIKHIDDYTGKKYTFNVPAGITLKKGQLVILENARGTAFGECVTDSEMLSDNAYSMLNGGNAITGWVVGIRTITDCYFGTAAE